MQGSCTSPVAKHLALHVGHGKTGSSYLQAWLAGNAERLAAGGIIYPLEAPSGQRERQAQLGLFSMGNGFVLQELENAADPVEALAELAQMVPEGGSLLFSDERLMKRLVGRLGAFAEQTTAAGFAQLTILLFVRDPLDQARSLYLEMVKAHGYGGSLNDWLEINNLHEHVLAFLQEQAALAACGPIPCRLTAANYSRCSRDLLPVLRHWLPLPLASATWPLPPRQRVNRSLSARELALMRMLNRQLGARGGGIGRALVRLRPRAGTAQPEATPAALAAFSERLGQPVAAINQLLPAEAQLLPPSHAR